MPAKGIGLVHGNRFNVITRQFWKNYVESSGIEITFEQFKAVINKSNEKIKSLIVSNVGGYKMNESLGYIVVKRYKPKPGERSVDYAKSKQAGCLVYHTNFHSYGYKGRIMWLTNKISTCKYIGVYKFVAARDFSRSVSEQLKAGKVYNEYSYDYFKAKQIRVNVNKLT